MGILRKFIYILIIIGFSCFQAAFAKASPEKYGIAIQIDSLEQQQAIKTALDSFVSKNPLLVKKHTIIGIERPRVMQDKTADFYLLLLLCVMLGVVRYGDSRYFNNMWRVFYNPGQGRAAKEQLEIAFVPNMIMNLFFGVVVGVYLYYLAIIHTPQRVGSIAPPLLILMLIAGVIGIYMAKYIVIKFSGWVFKIESISEYYIFNIFLINKIIAIVLLPFVLLLAFGGRGVAGPAIIVSSIAVGLLLVNRYIRSWQVFGSFFQYSKFHFFTYLCASEILPLAVLMKLLVRGLLF